MQNEIITYQKSYKAIVIVVCLTVIIACLSIVALVWREPLERSITAKIDTPELFELRGKTAKDKALLEHDKVLLEKLKIKKEMEITRKEIELIPNNIKKGQIKGAFWFGFSVMLILGVPSVFVAMIYQKSQELAAVILAWRRQETSDQSREMIRLLAAEIGYNKELLKVYKQLPQELKPLIEHPALPPAQAPNALQCLQRGLIAPEKPFFFGMTKDGQAQYEELQYPDVGAYHVGLIGEGRIGKSNALVNIAAQAELKGQLILCLDLHYPNKQSFTEKFGVLAKTPNFRGYHNIKDALEAIWFLDTLLNKRLNSELSSIPYIVVICDELKNLMRQVKRMGDDMFQHVAGVLERLTEEGGKNFLSFVVASHTWLAKDLGTTAWRDLLNYHIGLRSTPRQAQTFGFEKEYKNQFKGLNPGEIIYEDMGGACHNCQVPLWTPAAIDKAASMVQEVSWPDIAEPTAQELDEYAQKVVKLSDRREEVLERLRTAKHGEGKQIAKEFGYTPQHISRLKKEL